MSSDQTIERIVDETEAPDSIGPIGRVFGGGVAGVVALTAQAQIVGGSGAEAEVALEGRIQGSDGWLVLDTWIITEGGQPVAYLRKTPRFDQYRWTAEAASGSPIIQTLFRRVES